jgi:hypothetical protein
MMNVAVVNPIPARRSHRRFSIFAVSPKYLKLPNTMATKKRKASVLEKDENNMIKSLENTITDLQTLGAIVDEFSDDSQSLMFEKM